MSSLVGFDTTARITPTKDTSVLRCFDPPHVSTVFFSDVSSYFYQTVQLVLLRCLLPGLGAITQVIE